MKEHNGKKELPALPVTADSLRANLAIGTLTLFISALLLFILNYTIYSIYHPDIKAIIDKVVPLSIYPAIWFVPEPVESLQYQLSLISMPFIIFGAYMLVNKKKNLFYNNSKLCVTINLTGIAILIIFIINILTENLLHIPDETNAYFFRNNLLGVFSPFIAIIFYSLIAYLFYLYYKLQETKLRKTITTVIFYGIVAFIIFDVILYNVFHLANVDINISGETNAVYYSITQVYAGKSLLVDFNCQYGLYAWILLPVFRIIGLSSYKIGMVMGILNGISFFLIYLGIKKIIKQDLQLDPEDCISRR